MIFFRDFSSREEIKSIGLRTCLSKFEKFIDVLNLPRALVTALVSAIVKELRDHLATIGRPAA